MNPIPKFIRSPVKFADSLRTFPGSSARLASWRTYSGKTLKFAQPQSPKRIRFESGTLLDERRLELAYSGLKARTQTISQVAWEAGFEDPNYFSRWFKKESGKAQDNGKQAQ